MEHSQLCKDAKPYITPDGDYCLVYKTYAFIKMFRAVSTIRGMRLPPLVPNNDISNSCYAVMLRSLLCNNIDYSIMDETLMTSLLQQSNNESQQQQQQQQQQTNPIDLKINGGIAKIYPSYCNGTFGFCFNDSYDMVTILDSYFTTEEMSKINFRILNADESYFVSFEKLLRNERCPFTVCKNSSIQYLNTCDTSRNANIHINESNYNSNDSTTPLIPKMTNDNTALYNSGKTTGCSQVSAVSPTSATLNSSNDQQNTPPYISELQSTITGNTRASSAKVADRYYSPGMVVESNGRFIRVAGPSNVNASLFNSSAVINSARKRKNIDDNTTSNSNNTPTKSTSFQTIWSILRSVGWTRKDIVTNTATKEKEEFFFCPFVTATSYTGDECIENINYFHTKEAIAEHYHSNPVYQDDYNQLWQKLAKHGWVRDSLDGTLNKLKYTLSGVVKQPIVGLHVFYSTFAITQYISKYPYLLQEDAEFAKTLSSHRWTCFSNKYGATANSSKSIKQLKVDMWVNPALLYSHYDLYNEDKVIAAIKVPELIALDESYRTTCASIVNTSSSLFLLPVQPIAPSSNTLKRLHTVGGTLSSTEKRTIIRKLSQIEAAKVNTATTAGTTTTNGTTTIVPATTTTTTGSASGSKKTPTGSATKKQKQSKASINTEEKKIIIKKVMNDRDAAKGNIGNAATDGNDTVIKEFYNKDNISHKDADIAMRALGFVYTSCHWTDEWWKCEKASIAPWAASITPDKYVVGLDYFFDWRDAIQYLKIHDVKRVKPIKLSHDNYTDKQKWDVNTRINDIVTKVGSSAVRSEYNLLALLKLSGWNEFKCRNCVDNVDELYYVPYWNHDAITPATLSDFIEGQDFFTHSNRQAIVLHLQKFQNNPFKSSSSSISSSSSSSSSRGSGSSNASVTKKSQVAAKGGSDAVVGTGSSIGDSASIDGHKKRNRQSSRSYMPLSQDSNSSTTTSSTYSSRSTAVAMDAARQPSKKAKKVPIAVDDDTSVIQGNNSPKQALRIDMADDINRLTSDVSMSPAHDGDDANASDADAHTDAHIGVDDKENASPVVVQIPNTIEEAIQLTRTALTTYYNSSKCLCRTDELKSIKKIITDSLFTGKGCNVYIYGASGQGKTAVVATVIESFTKVSTISNIKYEYKCKNKSTIPFNVIKKQGTLYNNNTDTFYSDIATSLDITAPKGQSVKSFITNRLQSNATNTKASKGNACIEMTMVVIDELDLVSPVLVKELLSISSHPTSSLILVGLANKLTGIGSYQHSIAFAAYTSDQITTILMDRCYGLAEPRAMEIIAKNCKTNDVRLALQFARNILDKVIKDLNVSVLSTAVRPILVYRTVIGMFVNLAKNSRNQVILTGVSTSARALMASLIVYVNDLNKFYLPEAYSAFNSFTVKNGLAATEKHQVMRLLEELNGCSLVYGGRSTTNRHVNVDRIRYSSAVKIEEMLRMEGLEEVYRIPLQMHADELEHRKLKAATNDTFDFDL